MTLTRVGVVIYKWLDLYKMLRKRGTSSSFKAKSAFYLTLMRSIVEHCSIIWRPLSFNQISKIQVIQKRPIKWIIGQRIDHLTDREIYEKDNEINILPIKLKVLLNDLVLFYKITNL